MTKPNDISDDAWEVANGLLQRHRSPKVSVELQNAIARALEAYALKKVEEERERCARLVEGYAVAKHHNSEPVLVERKVPSQTSILIAQSIRNRSA